MGNIASGNGKNVAQGRRAALLGDKYERERRPRVQGRTLRQRTGARTLPKGAARHSQATERGINVAQGCRPALTGNRKGHKTSPKGAARHSQATKRGKNVAQGCRPALTGNRKGHKHRPRVSPGTHRRQKGAKTSPKGAARHSQATERGINVAQGCRPALTGNEKGRKRRSLAQPSPQVTIVAGGTAYEACRMRH